MNLKLLICKNAKIILALGILAVGVLFREKIESLYSSFVGVNVSQNVAGLFSLKQLAVYNGVEKNSLYLAIMGSVFDVTKGRKHYAEGATYNYFIGKDGSRAFVTGDFKDESIKRDHVLDLSCDELLSLIHWRDTLGDKYKPVGLLIGRYYNENGKETSYMKELRIKIEHCKTEKEVEKKEELKYPPCNAEWGVDTGTRVWCTKTSGGVSRSWVGVPRQLYTPGNERPRCACVNPDTDNSGALLKEYENCPLSASSCNTSSS